MGLCLDSYLNIIKLFKGSTLIDVITLITIHSICEIINQNKYQRQVHSKRQYLQLFAVTDFRTNCSEFGCFGVQRVAQEEQQFGGKRPVTLGCP